MISAGQTPPPGGQQQYRPSPPPSSGGTQGTGLAPNIASLLCYLVGAPYCVPITGIIFLLIEKDDLDVKFHAWQSVSLGVAYLIAIAVLQILATILGLIASVLGIIVGFLVPIIILAAFILWIVCMIKAYQGERWRIPVIGDFAAQRAGI